MRTLIASFACLIGCAAASLAEDAVTPPTAGGTPAPGSAAGAEAPLAEQVWEAREGWSDPSATQADEPAGAVPALPLPVGPPQQPEAPQTPEQEVRTLGDYGIAYTTRALQSGAQFYPFAFVMRHDGAIQRIAPAEIPSFPTQEELLATLVAGLAEESVHRKYKAVAVVVDVVIALPDGRESEAIQLGLEHDAGFCRNVFYPYTLSEEGQLRFEKPLSGKRRGRIYSACN